MTTRGKLLVAAIVLLVLIPCACLWLNKSLIWGALSILAIVLMLYAAWELWLIIQTFWAKVFQMGPTLEDTVEGRQIGTWPEVGRFLLWRILNLAGALGIAGLIAWAGSKFNP
jgi:hypothetical protein